MAFIYFLQDLRKEAIQCHKFHHFFHASPMPELSLPVVGGGQWNLSEQNPDHFTMVVIYRGLHCPICSKYLADLNSKVEKFSERGVTVFVASSDTQERAEEAKEKWKLDKLTLGYGLSLEKGRELGLYISTSRGKTSLGIVEPDLFVEPGLFLVRPNGELYFATVSDNAICTSCFCGYSWRPRFCYC